MISCCVVKVPTLPAKLVRGDGMSLAANLENDTFPVIVSRFARLAPQRRAFLLAARSSMRFVNARGRWILDFGSELAALGTLIEFGDRLARDVMSTSDVDGF
jgi:hypothetical protein